MRGHDGLLCLHDLPMGVCGEVVDLVITGPVRQRLLALGFLPGTRIKAVRKSPAGDPVAFWVRGTLIALRREEGRAVLVRPLHGRDGEL